MSAELYNNLFDPNASHQGTDALVAAFAIEGRLRRAALELANDEMLDGMWVEEERAPEQAMRYAADDRDGVQASFSGEGFTVVLRLAEQGWTATQTAGTAGASLKVDGAWVVLTPDQAVTMPIDAMPDKLLLVDLSGQEVTLTR